MKKNKEIEAKLQAIKDICEELAKEHKCYIHCSISMLKIKRLWQEERMDKDMRDFLGKMS